MNEAITNLFVLVPGVFVLVVFFRGLFIVSPREAHVILYWGKYSRTVTEPGFHFAFQIGLQRRVTTTRDIAIATPVTTVVEKHGNPIQVSAVVVYRITDAARALIDVQGYQNFVATQATSVIKSVCSRFPYEGEDDEPCLKKESGEVLEALTSELQVLANKGGIQIDLVRLNDLTYAPELAQSMLLRQQAIAMVDARRTLVDGAITTVKEALDQLKKVHIEFTPETRNRLASNLTLLLCAGERGEHSAVVTRSRSD